MLSTRGKVISSVLLLLCGGLPIQARSVKILEVHVELISPSGSALVCEQRVADALRQIAGNCLSECDSLVGFNSAMCSMESGYDVVTLRGGIFGSSEDVIGSIPCIRATLAADGCRNLASEAIPSIGSLRYIGGVDTLTPTITPQTPASAPTGTPTINISTSAPSSPNKATRTPTPSPSATLNPVMKPVMATVEPTSQSPVAVPEKAAPVATVVPSAEASVTAGTAFPSGELVLAEEAFLSQYVVLIALAVTAATLFCCLVVLIIWVNRSYDSDSVVSSSKAKRGTSFPHDHTSEESASWSSRNSSKKERQAEERLNGIDLPSLHKLRDDISSVLEKDELSSDGSSIREDKFDASDDEYETPPDETEVTCDASETEDHSEYDFSVSAAEFTRTTRDFDNENSSVGSLSTNSFSYYFNFDERDMENEAKRKQFLNWLKTSKIVPPSAKYAIEASLVSTYGPLRDDHRPIVVKVASNLADPQDSAGKLV